MSIRSGFHAKKSGGSSAWDPFPLPCSANFRHSPAVSSVDTLDRFNAEALCFLPICPDVRDLTKLALDPRTAIMAVAEVVWEDQLGAWRGAVARVNDTSRFGACIRVSVPINVGAKLKITCHRVEFSGV